MTVTQKEIDTVLRLNEHSANWPSELVELANRIQAEGIAPPDGYAIVPVDSLKYWRELVDLNPKDLAPRIEAMLTAAKESL